VRNNWHLKLGAFVLAVLFWFFVSTDDAALSQRSLRAPLKVEGLREGQIASGVPDTVEVRVSGPSYRIDALRPEGVDAVLDLRDAEGAFEQPVRVFPPQGIWLVSVNPSEVLGTVETRRSKEVPVEVALIGGPEDALLEASTTPRAVTVRGPEGQVERVERALAPVSAPEGVVVGVYPVDAAGQPVTGVSLEPHEVTLSVRETPVLHTRRVPVEVAPLELASLSVAEATLTPEAVTLVGPKEALEGLGRVIATPQLTPPLATSDAGPGRYTLETTLELPEGVLALQAPRLELRLVLPEGARP